MKNIFIVALVLSSCGYNTVISCTNCEDNEIKALAEISKIEEADADSSALIYGKIKLTSINRFKKYVDLTCFQIKQENYITSKIYVDSVAHFNQKRMLFDEDGKLDINVYWYFEKNYKDIDIKKIQLFKIKENCLLEK